MTKKIYKLVARELNLPEEVVEEAYESFWIYIKNTIESLPLKEDLTIQELQLMRTNFNIPSIGKLYCLPTKIIQIKNKIKNNGKR